MPGGQDRLARHQPRRRHRMHPVLGARRAVPTAQFGELAADRSEVAGIDRVPQLPRDRVEYAMIRHRRGPQRRLYALADIHRVEDRLLSGEYPGQPKP